MRAWRVTTAAATAVAGFAGVAVWAFGPSDVQEMELTAVRGSATGYGFQIDASPVTGLYPGAVQKLTLSFHNPYDFPLTVTGTRGLVVATSRQGCLPSASNLTIDGYKGSLPMTIPAGDRKAGGHLPLRMPNSVVDACQGAKFTIRLQGDATKAARR